MSGSRVLNGRYELVELLGRGGMADVHLGRDIRLGRTIAVKILRPDLARDPQFQARFRREAQAVAGLNHPSIVAVYDTGDTIQEGQGSAGHEPTRLPYIVMEYVQGRTLRDLIRENGVGIDQAIGYTLGVLSALEYSHRSGIVHRDIKPANVMVTHEGNSVKVMDFGIARAIADASATMTHTQAVIGTAQYLSPEQARGETVDARSDLYSAACLFYEMLTGRPPFIGDSPVSVAYQHVRETAAAPSQFNSEVSPALDSVLARALQKDRDDRFQDAASFRRALSAAKAGVQLAPAAPMTTDQLAAEIPTTLHPATEPISTQVVPVPAVVEENEPTTRAVAKVLAGGSLTTGDIDDSPDPVDSGAEIMPLESASDGEIERTRRRRRRAWIITLFLALLVVLGGGGYLLYSMFTNTSSPPTVTVPKVAGMTETDALSSLFNAKLKSTTERVFSDTVKAGYVIGTHPAEGSSVAPESLVTLKVSKGPATIEIPTSLIGMTESAARDTLRQRGLIPGTTTMVDNPKLPRGQVVSTSPAAGEKVGAESVVNLNVSSGQVKMPALYGVSRQEAQNIINALGARISVNFVEEENSQVPPGTVTGQDPEPGTEVDQNALVTVKLSKAPPTSSPRPTATPTPSPTSSQPAS